MLDVLLAALLSLLQIGMALLGIIVSIKPQPEARHRQLIVAFAVMALTGVVITITQQIRSTRAQDVLSHELAEIKKNTERPSTVNVTALPAQVTIEKSDLPVGRTIINVDRFAVTNLGIPWISADRPLEVWLYFKNGTGLARNVYTQAGAVVTRSGYPRSHSLDSEAFEIAYHQISKDVSRQDKVNLDLGPNEETRVPVHMKFDAPTAANIMAGKQFFYAVGIVRWSDKGGRYERQICYCAEPRGPSNLLWPTCYGHNTIRKIK